MVSRLRLPTLKVWIRKTRRKPTNYGILGCRISSRYQTLRALDRTSGLTLTTTQPQVRTPRCYYIRDEYAYAGHYRQFFPIQSTTGNQLCRVLAAKPYFTIYALLGKTLCHIGTDYCTQVGMVRLANFLYRCPKLGLVFLLCLIDLPYGSAEHSASFDK